MNDDLVEGSESPGRGAPAECETDLVPNAGLLPAAVLAQRIDLAGLIDSRLHLARQGANSQAKALT